MLLANLAKSDHTLRHLTLNRTIPKTLSTSPLAISQLMDCFVKGASGTYNKNANFDYLSYFFADLSKHKECRDYFLTPQPSDENIIPLSKILVFTEHPSHIRRLGVASTIKNVCFDVSSHPKLLAPHYVDSKAKPLLTFSSNGAGGEQEEKEPDPLNLLPYILLPLCGPEDFSPEDQEDMLEDLQLLPPDKKRETDTEILKTHLETLLLLTTTKEGRETLRKVKVYPVVRELHAQIDDEGVREGCDRLVQVLMRDEKEDEVDEKMDAAGLVDDDRGQAKPGKEERVTEVDSDEEVIDVL